MGSGYAFSATQVRRSKVRSWWLFMLNTLLTNLLYYGMFAMRHRFAIFQAVTPSGMLWCGFRAAFLGDDGIHQSTSRVKLSALCKHFFWGVLAYACYKAMTIL